MTSKEFYNLNYVGLTQTLINRKYVIIQDETNRQFKVYMQKGLEQPFKKSILTRNFKFLLYPNAEMIQMNVPYSSEYSKIIKQKYSDLILQS